MNSVVFSNNINNQIHSQTFEKKKHSAQIIDKTPEDKLNRYYRSQGLLGKSFDKIQGALNIGLSKKKLQQELKNNNKSDFDKNLNKYYDQQKNETEIAIDLATGLSAATALRFIKKAQTYSHMYVKNQKFEKISTLIGIGISACAGMITKPILKGINGIGMPKKEKKQERTVLKDMGSGFIDGIAAPLTYINKLGLIGAIGINSASRYVFNKKADKESGLKEHLNDGWAIKLPALGIAAFSAFRFHKRVDVLEKAIVNAKNNVKNIEIFKAKAPLSELKDLGVTSLKDKQTQLELIDTAKRGFFSKTYMKLTARFRKKSTSSPIKKSLEFIPKPFKRILFMDKEIIKQKEMERMMAEIEQYNLFYPKMLQVLPSNVEDLLKMLMNKSGGSLSDLKAIKINENDNLFKKLGKKFLNKRANYISEHGIKSINEFLNNYKSNCPSSRTVKEAQNHLEKTFGNKYTILGEKPLGVGTIAESYLAKDNKSNKEVVIKMTKKWATPEKLQNDKQKMLATIERMKGKLTEDEYNYQRKLVDELYNAWSKELDLGLEAEAAKTLAKYAINYNTVAPIEVKNNMFVMEKAKGIQFDKLGEYLEKNNKKLTKKEDNTLMAKYFQLFFEQLLSVPKKGNKVMHADPHAGNIFIDITNKEKPFTFIDTGNVLRFTPEEAIQNVTSHVDYVIGNSKPIANRLLKDAKLPAGMKMEEAEKMLAKHLDETFYSGKYKIRTADPFSAINNESIKFMSQNKVILSTRNTNLLKAEIAYLSNIMSLGKILEHVDMSTTVSDEEMKKLGKQMGKQVLESITSGIINNKKCTIKEVYNRLKYLHDNPEQFMTTLYTYFAPKN